MNLDSVYINIVKTFWQSAASHNEGRTHDIYRALKYTREYDEFLSTDLGNYKRPFPSE